MGPGSKKIVTLASSVQSVTGRVAGVVGEGRRWAGGWCYAREV